MEDIIEIEEIIDSIDKQLLRLKQYTGVDLEKGFKCRWCGRFYDRT